MPKNKSAVIRHRIIDQMLTNKRRPYPTLEQLAAKCSAILGSDVSTSTIEKDIRAKGTRNLKVRIMKINYL
jgi:hypothetical protein